MCRVVWFCKKRKETFSQKCDRLLCSGCQMNASSLAFGEQNLPPLFESVLKLHHRKRKKKKCQATPYVVVVQDGSNMHRYIIYATVSFLTLKLQQRIC